MGWSSEALNIGEYFAKYEKFAIYLGMTRRPVGVPVAA